MKALTSVLKLLITSIAAGAVIAVVGKALFWLFDEAIKLIWETLPEALGLEASALPYLLLGLGVGGLLVGLGNRFLGYHPRALEDVMADVKAGEGIEHKKIPHIIGNSIIALGFGGPLGPEAALVGVLGGIYYWVKETMEGFASDALEVLNPDAGDRTVRTWTGAPTVIAGVFVVLVWRWLPGGIDLSFVPAYENPGESIALILALVTGIIAGVLGVLSERMEGRVRGFKIWERAPELMGIIGGVVVALLASGSFLVLTSGAENMGALFDGSTSTGEMAYAGAAKWVALMVVLAMGWKGGPIFPLMFISGALAVAAGDILGVEPLILYAAAIAGAVAGALRSIVLGVLVAMLVVPSSVLVLMIVGAAGAGLVMRMTSAEEGEAAPATG